MRRLLPAAILVVSVSVACGQATSEHFAGPSGGGASSSGGITAGSGGGGSSGGTGTFGDGGLAADSSAPASDPTTCAEAASAHSYIGCDYWPTTLSNFVWSIFDFAVVVANPQQAPATVTLTGPAGYTKQVTVAPGALTKVYLPWVDALKGPQWDTCTDIPAFTASIAAPKGAYHLVSSLPVTVYQFNALEYAPQGGPSGKNWSSCPGDQSCQGSAFGCFSFSNDASLLLPTTALTGDYRLMGVMSSTGQGSYFAVTGTQDGTTVTVTLSQTARVAA
ncbi:MAG TPA: hypothetical protein VIY73_15870, partial [Polyangiaceae bacterium]